MDSCTLSTSLTTEYPAWRNRIVSDRVFSIQLGIYTNDYTLYALGLFELFDFSGITTVSNEIPKKYCSGSCSSPKQFSQC